MHSLSSRACAVAYVQWGGGGARNAALVATPLRVAKKKKKAKTCCSIHYHSLLPVDFCSLLFPTLCTGIRWTIQTFQIPPALYSESRFLQVCLCPLSSVEEMWHQRPDASAFLWKLQRAKKDGKVVYFGSYHFVVD